ncbi:DNA/RNA non-specific endonuclease [uncultured Lactobacillus sp.]|uniref:DNA/RNA non-specific endonuclease n=1 Tax=uncultured Lactobacillus sp. TaxID=153152 RepID=UPI0026059EDF|nr:DNA/RNA non-specific endonuclease [uncultured Lactobacillus sp.]
MKKQVLAILATSLMLGVSIGAGVSVNQDFASAKTKVVTKYKYDRSDELKAEKIDKENVATEKKIRSLDKKIKKLRQQLEKYSKATSVESVSAQKLAALNYSGQDIISVNNNNPSFTKADLSTKNGAWEKYSDLDNLNRAQSANALLNKSMMPRTKREALKVNPTGWHNKRIAGGWLYNRSHLIGYQLTGQNNNWKNLITGTRQLNDPNMLRYEDQVAQYLKQSPSNYVRYRVTPIFRGNELLARGVQMEGQSISSNEIHFNVYIFNVENGMNLNYADGTSKAA